MTNYLGQQSCKWGWGEGERRLSLPCMCSLSGIHTVVFHAKLVQIQLLGTGLAFAAICGEKEMTHYTFPLMLSIGTFYLLATFFLALSIVTRYLYHVFLCHHCLLVTRYSFVATNILYLSSYLTRYSLLALH